MRSCPCRSSCSQMFFKLSVLKNFPNFTVLESLFNNVAGLQACNFFKKSLQRRCFPVKFAKFLGTSFFTEHLRWLLLSMIRLRHINHGHNQEYFRAREVTWNKGTLINNSSTIERKAPQGKTSQFFLLDTLKTAF